MTKRALVVGINAYGGQNTLQGCVNDAHDWGELLMRQGFSVAYLLDAEATGGNIREAVKKGIADSKYGDRFVWTYSGHGTTMMDYDGDEADRQDEAICPVDCFQNGMMVDDEIANMLGAHKVGVRVSFIPDSCHSGTVNRALNIPAPGLPPDARPRMIPITMFSHTARERTPRPRRSVRSVLLGSILMSGCLDPEYSYDASFQGRPNGAFTRVAIDAFNRLGQPTTYNAWQSEIRKHLPSDSYPQTPALSGSSYRRHWKPLV